MAPLSESSHQGDPRGLLQAVLHAAQASGGRRRIRSRLRDNSRANKRLAKYVQSVQRRGQLWLYKAMRKNQGGAISRRLMRSPARVKSQFSSALPPGKLPLIRPAAR